MKSSVSLTGQKSPLAKIWTRVFTERTTDYLIKGFMLVSLLMFALDSGYRLINNISYSNKEVCFLFNNSSKEFFLFYENFVELWLVMIFGIFCAVLLSKYFSKYGRFYPKGPVSAFLYGSLMPVCSCSTIPLLTLLKGKIKFRTIITFVMAAPLLSPIIIFLSFSVLDVKYAVLRIICSFILSVGAGFFLELFYKPEDEIALDVAVKCDKNCMIAESSILHQTWNTAKKLIPYILIAGTLACIVSIFENDLVRYLHQGINSWYGKIAAVVIGIPMYVCNGADIFLLKPLMNNSLGLPYGSAIAFSLSSSAVCVASIVLLSKILGKKLTVLLIAYIFAVCLGFGLLL